MSIEFHTIQGSPSYSVRWYDDLSDSAKDLFFIAPSKWVIITEINVDKACNSDIKKLEDGLSRIAPVVKLTLPKTGEELKTINCAEEVCKKLNELGVDRKSCIIAFGGGTIGDLIGFVASIYMRGVKLVHIPTTLIAQVDSSIGGKTGVNSDFGKNLIGTFYNPVAVSMFSSVLKTLPEDHYRAGYAEIIKYALINDANMFKHFSENYEKFLNKDYKYLHELIVYSVKAKTGYVINDMKDFGKRQYLNFGHTFGHALEKLSNFKLHHGFAVSVGMAMAFRYASSIGICSKKDSDMVEEHLSKVGLPIAAKYKPEDLIDCMRIDKKNLTNKVTLILPKMIGSVVVHKVEKEEVLLNWLNTDSKN